jgi:hypothetical protein
VRNDTFYAAAATVIPLLLIAIMATRSLRPGELRQQPTSTALAFGLPIIGELAAFAFLFFEPAPTAAAVILAVVTWAGLLSQLGFAAWWLVELLRRDADKVPASNADKPTATEGTKEPDLPPGRRYRCHNPACAWGGSSVNGRCPQCGTIAESV